MSAGGFFVYAGRSSREFGILVDSVDGLWDSPERDTESVEIPGRHGALTIDNGRWRNNQGAYKCGIGVDFQPQYENFRSFFAANIGYKRLEDSWHPDEFRLARPRSGLAPTLFKNGLTGEFEVPLDAMPQRFLKTGETPVSLPAGRTTTIENPTRYAAQPLLTVEGSGTLRIGSDAVIVAQHPGVLVIDLALGDAYSQNGHENYNRYITLPDELPDLEPGANSIAVPSGMTVTITPRWWTL
jgi:phage-related protein